ncbi:hypothetical protein CMEL01_04951 [Colletotrichum melonis]|uniref:Uncharacterized protein n=2 Tax=Colletotrichum acutatum species complex TaxID=2707335 RepID=A0AAI9UA80_9PEZI|nr:hypothetical protein CLIM01_00263 [Colletotrichum limetticola]KAK1453292.1 hypothetical protein CMEL01_04951 [Colletotrichum melonis]
MQRGQAGVPTTQRIPGEVSGCLGHFAGGAGIPRHPSSDQGVCVEGARRAG